MAQTQAETDRGPVYKDTNTDQLVLVLDNPDTVGVPTHEAENKQVELETVDNRQWYTVFKDNFRSNYVKVADSVDDLEED